MGFVTGWTMKDFKDLLTYLLRLFQFIFFLIVPVVIPEFQFKLFCFWWWCSETWTSAKYHSNYSKDKSKTVSNYILLTVPWYRGVYIRLCIWGSGFESHRCPVLSCKTQFKLYLSTQNKGQHDWVLQAISTDKITSYHRNQMNSIARTLWKHKTCVQTTEINHIWQL